MNAFYMDKTKTVCQFLEHIMPLTKACLPNICWYFPKICTVLSCRNKKCVLITFRLNKIVNMYGHLNGHNDLPWPSRCVVLSEGLLISVDGSVRTIAQKRSDVNSIGVFDVSFLTTQVELSNHFSWNLFQLILEY